MVVFGVGCGKEAPCKRPPGLENQRRVPVALLRCHGECGVRTQRRIKKRPELLKKHKDVEAGVLVRPFFKAGSNTRASQH
jgi:hypothetical protein